jgi:hypothetical protein
MKIRHIDTTFGILFVLVAGAGATYAILHTLNSIPPSYLANYQILQGA